MRIFHTGGEYTGPILNKGGRGCRTISLLENLHRTCEEKGLNTKMVVPSWKKRMDPHAPIVLDYSGSPYIFFAKCKTRYKPHVWVQRDGATRDGEIITTQRELWVVDDNPDETFAAAQDAGSPWLLDALTRQKNGVNWLDVPGRAWLWWQRGRNQKLHAPFLKPFEVLDRNFDIAIESRKAEIAALEAELAIKKAEEGKQEQRDLAAIITAQQGKQKAEEALESLRLENSQIRERMAALEKMIEAQGADDSPKRRRSATT